MILSEVAEFVVQGITVNDEVFQPADWAERLCDMLSHTPADGRAVYSAYMRPMMIGGVKSVVVRTSLQRVDAQAFELITQFVTSNKLKVRAGRGSRDAEATGKFAAYSERRDPNRNNW
jgi:Protein of unknown function (DUF3579)